MEIIQFENQTPLFWGSFNLGAVRLASPNVEDRKKPISQSQRENIEVAVRTELQSSPIDPDLVSNTCVLTGGSASILAELAPVSSGVQQIDSNKVASLRDEVCNMEFDQRISILGIPEKRADIFPTAAIILCELINYLGCKTLFFSFYNLRFGLATELIEKYQSDRS